MEGESPTLRPYMQGIYQRMCANLVHIYNSQRDHEKLKMMLDLITAINPQVRRRYCS